VLIKQLFLLERSQDVLVRKHFHWPIKEHDKFPSSFELKQAAQQSVFSCWIACVLLCWLPCWLSCWKWLICW